MNTRAPAAHYDMPMPITVENKQEGKISGTIDAAVDMMPVTESQQMRDMENITKPAAEQNKQAKKEIN
jgi:hypothetical protein